MKNSMAERELWEVVDKIVFSMTDENKPVRSREQVAQMSELCTEEVQGMSPQACDLLFGTSVTLLGFEFLELIKTRRDEGRYLDQIPIWEIEEPEYDLHSVAKALFALVVMELHSRDLLDPLSLRSSEALQG